MSTVRRLIKQLKDEDPNVRRIAARVLGFIGPDAKEAVPALTEALKDHNQYVRYQSFLALNEIERKAGGV
jgi:HEAT repeat protein